MKTHGEAVKLRRKLRERDGARGKRFDPALRARVIGFAEQRRSEGASWMAIATELGACFETIRRWCVAAPAPAAMVSSPPARIRPVRVVAEPAIEVVTQSAMKVVTPNGLRVEG